MKCALNLWNENEYIEVSMDILDKDIALLKKHIDEKEMSFGQFIDDLIETYIKTNNL